MNLLIILLALSLRYFGIGAEPATLTANLMRRWRDGWLDRGQREGWGGGIALLFIILAPTLVVAALVLTLRGHWHDLWSCLLSLVVLLVVLLDQRWPTALQHERDTWQASDEAQRQTILQADHQELEAATEAEFSRVRRSLLAAQLNELFSPLFWFVLLGPIAAIAYYFWRLAAESESGAGQLARKLLHYADWLPARALAFSFVLAGNFVAGWSALLRNILDVGVTETDLLDVCANAAQPTPLQWSVEVMPGEALGAGLSAVNTLLQRALVIWIVLLALHTLWS